MLSSSVANALEYFGNPETKETETFVCHFDRFFDCLNVRSIEEDYKKQKEDLLSYYTTSDDERLKVTAADIKNSCLLLYNFCTA